MLSSLMLRQREVFGERAGLTQWHPVPCGPQRIRDLMLRQRAVLTQWHSLPVGRSDGPVPAGRRGVVFVVGTPTYLIPMDYPYCSSMLGFRTRRVRGSEVNLRVSPNGRLRVIRDRPRLLTARAVPRGLLMGRQGCLSK
jgi:hypothetical protein